VKTGLSSDFPDVVRSVAFSSDGYTLAWGTNDGAVVLWDASDPESATQIGTSLRGHKSEVQGLAFSPDGKNLASGSQDRTIILWDVSLESWQALACRGANRNLRNDEWNLYLSRYYGRNSYRKTCDGLPAGE
jgi:WD40 repeat protein